MVVEFVSSRGGGFMMLGGRNSFSGGRYQNSPIADILPVQLSPENNTPILERLKIALTPYGRTHNLMKLTPDASANVKQWTDLPPLNWKRRSAVSFWRAVSRNQEVMVPQFFSPISAMAEAERWLLRQPAVGNGRWGWITRT
jgi:hypothetical protein